MAGERTLPGLGLTGFWDLGSAYKPGMDSNLLAMSVLAQLRVKSRVTALPGSPADGDVYIVPSGANANEIAVRDNGAWVYFVPAEGYGAYVEDEGAFVRWDGAGWAAFDLRRNAQSGTAYSLTELDLRGEVIIEMDNAAANTLTVPSGLVGRNPVTVIQKGAGQTVFAAGAGVTINSLDAKLNISGQYAAATLIPRGGDAYYLIGALAT